MSDLYVLWGSAGHTKVLASLIALQGGRIVALFDNNHEVRSVLPNIPIYYGEEGFLTWANSVENTKHYCGLVSIGGHRGQDRLYIQELFSSHEVNVKPLIHPKAFVCSSASIGRGTQILAGAIIAADSQIGQACIINHKGSVDHECILGDGVHIAPGATLCGCVKIGYNVMIGAGAVVLPRLEIGDNSIIGAGAVVTKSIVSNSVMIGNPAHHHR